MHMRREPGGRGAPRVEAGAREHYEDAAYYDFAYRDRRDDVAYYVAAARVSGGPVLEYGVGTGRVGLELARAGVHIVGIDRAKPMLDAFRARLHDEPSDVAARVELRRGDMRRVRLRRRFPLVIAPFNTLLHLYSRRDVEQFLARVREHLSDGGRFVFDVLMPRGADLALDPQRSYRAPRFRHPTTGELTAYSERFEYDPVRQVMFTTMVFRPVHGAKPQSVTLSHRYFFPQELAALLYYNGFSEPTWREDFTGDEPGRETDCLVVSCRKRTRAGRN